MTTRKSNKKSDTSRDQNDDSAERLAGLLRDMETLQAYLQERGRHSYDLAQKFLANARRDAGSRAYDERQATMLEYQHYIWHEIAGRVSQLLMAWGEPEDTAEDATLAEKPPTSDESKGES